MNKNHSPAFYLSYKKMNPTPEGTYTALITPFDHSGHIDEEGFRQLIRFQIEHGVDGISPLGTTGESPTLLAQEKQRIMAIAKEETEGKCCLMIGTGSYATSQTIENTRLAEEHGADLALVVSPYYNRPTQEGLFQHFKAVANSSTLSIVLYNVQSRTGQNLHIETLKRLMDIPNIVAIKEASGNIAQINEIIELAKSIRPCFKVLSGDDALTLPLMALGGHGIISVASNLVPNKVKALTNALQENNYSLARKLHFDLMPLFKILFIETNPIPVKTAMGFYGMPAGPCRLPLYQLSPEHNEKLRLFIQSFLIDKNDALNLGDSQFTLSCYNT